MRVVLYARRACATPGTESTLESQLEALRDQAARQGMEIIAEFRDDGASGLRRRRPGLEGMRELARRSGFDVLLTCGPDRLARNSALLHRILQELAQLRIRTLFLEERAGERGVLGEDGPGRGGASRARGSASERDRGGKVLGLGCGTLLGSSDRGKSFDRPTTATG